MIPHSAPWISEADRQAVDARLRTGMVAAGEAVAEFEAAVRQWTGAAVGVARPSGADAIRSALEALGVGRGDEVILPTYVCESVMQSIRHVGASPVFADVNENAVVDPHTVAAVMTPATTAIIGVHTFGHLCDVLGMKALGLPVLEDACQAFGLQTPWGMAGAVGDLGVYSFHATKCLTTGEGGMLVAGGMSPAHLSKAPLQNLKSGLSDLQAALGLSQLRRYPEFLARRMALRLRYDHSLASQPTLTAHLPPVDSFLFRYTIRSPGGFERAQAFFAARGVTVRRGVDSLLHRHAGERDDRFPVSLKLYETTVSIPFHPALADKDVDTVVKAAEEFVHAQ